MGSTSIDNVNATQIVTQSDQKPDGLKLDALMASTVTGIVDSLLGVPLSEERVDTINTSVTELLSYGIDSGEITRNEPNIQDISSSKEDATKALMDLLNSKMLNTKFSQDTNIQEGMQAIIQKGFNGEELSEQDLSFLKEVFGENFEEVLDIIMALAKKKVEKILLETSFTEETLASTLQIQLDSLNSLLEQAQQSYKMASTPYERDIAKREIEQAEGQIAHFSALANALEH